MKNDIGTKRWTLTVVGRHRGSTSTTGKKRKWGPLTHIGQSLQLCANKASYGLVLCRSLEGPMPHLRSTIACPQTKSQNFSSRGGQGQHAKTECHKENHVGLQRFYEYMLKSILSSSLHLNSYFSRILIIYPKVYDHYFSSHIMSGLLSC